VAAVLAALDGRSAAGIVVAGPGWGFGHDLVRETARLELPTADRLAVHARMGAYLRGRPDAAPAVIAHHLLEALPIGDAGAAASWAERRPRRPWPSWPGRTPPFSMRGRCGPFPGPGQPTGAGGCAGWP
jgi:hypothetical protein